MSSNSIVLTRTVLHTSALGFQQGSWVLTLNLPMKKIQTLPKPLGLSLEVAQYTFALLYKASYKARAHREVEYASVFIVHNLAIIYNHHDPESASRHLKKKDHLLISESKNEF